MYYNFPKNIAAVSVNGIEYRPDETGGTDIPVELEVVEPFGLTKGEPKKTKSKLEA